MPDPADLTHGVLLRVAELLRKLPADQIAALADGSARLEVVPKGARVSQPGTGQATTRSTTRPAAPPAAQVRAELAKLNDRVAARRWLADQQLLVADLRALAGELGVPVPAKTRRDDVLDRIVRGTVGRRLDFEAISRPAPARF